MGSRSSRNTILLFVLVILIATAFRLPALSLRPMHTDEAVQAVKFGSLLKDGYYRYDSGEYHGPTLYYFTLIPAWVQSLPDLVSVTPPTLRSVPVFFGIASILILLLFVKGLGWPAVLTAGLLTAISPLMTFYSRYYIQETMLAFFAAAALASIWRYADDSKKAVWAVTGGLSLGLMHATKETSIIVIASLAIAGYCTLLLGKKESVNEYKINNNKYIKHGFYAVLIAVCVSALFYSSFFANPAGIVDSYCTYFHYAGKAANNQWHNHPWYYYIKLLLFSRGPGLLFWSEGLILLLAGMGIFATFSKKDVPGINKSLLRFIVLYSLLLMIIFSAIPYKTPWNMLCFMQGLIILAGAGAVALRSRITTGTGRTALTVIIGIGCVHLAVENWYTNFKYYANPENPYVYGHTSNDIFTVEKRIREIAAVHPAGKAMHIEVDCPGNDYWPLPWYLRDFSNVGWYGAVEMELPLAPVIISMPSLEPGVLKKVYSLPPPGEKSLYVPLFDGYTELRPSVELRGYVEKDLWDRFTRKSALDRENAEK